jgi:hypothetical protein
VNNGLPGNPQQAWIVTDKAGNKVEYLFVTNGRDDNDNGWVDEGWDGVDNDGDGLVDETFCNLSNHGEWETEHLVGAVASTAITNQTYSITRRPFPAANAREINLPSNVLIDLTSWNNLALFGTLPERSRVAFGALNTNTGTVDILVNPDGTVVPTTLYSTPASFGMSGTFFHLWLAERQDLYALQTNAQGNPVPLVPGPPPFYLPITQGAVAYNGPYLQGEYRVVTLFSRTGAVVTTDNPPFVINNAYSPNNPFIPVEQGVPGGSQ